MTIELTLPDMTCGHCVKTVTATAQRLDPAARVQTDLVTHRMTIDSSVAQEAFEAALAEDGYPVARACSTRFNPRPSKLRWPKTVTPPPVQPATRARSAPRAASCRARA
jgi:copper chaperone